MAGFIESPRFPDFVSVWATGGRGYSSSIVETLGGYEFRNANWGMAKGMWNISQALFAVSPQFATYNHAVLVKYFRACKAQIYGFRFKDFLDCSDDGNGVFVSLGGNLYQMYKRYVLSPNTELQIVQKPVTPIVVTTAGVVSSINYATGVVTMTSGTPTAWTGNYDIPCRFADDFPALGLDPSGALAAWQSMNIVETRDIT